MTTRNTASRKGICSAGRAAERRRGCGHRHATFSQAAKIGGLFGDQDLVTLAQHGQGQALIMLGEAARGMALLDESMVAVTADEVSPIVAGVVYCGVIEACQEMFDLRRAQEWTAALTRWCDSQPHLVPYRGQCLVYRAEIMQLHGAWPGSSGKRSGPRAAVGTTGQPAVGMALYRLGELHRLRVISTKPRGVPPG
jgi:hypothetical protein